jgi:hypothetical protein
MRVQIAAPNGREAYRLAPQLVGLTFTTSAEPVVETAREALGQDPETKLAPGRD